MNAVEKRRDKTKEYTVVGAMQAWTTGPYETREEAVGACDGYPGSYVVKHPVGSFDSAQAVTVYRSSQ